MSETKGVEVRVGTLQTNEGRKGVLRVGDHTLEFTAEMADELSARFREVALELRNGGAVS